MTKKSIPEIKAQIRNAFKMVRRPVSKSEDVIGCCEDHKERFEWYQTHLVDEFNVNVLRNHAYNTGSSGLDPYEFSSLRSDYFLYFTPGFLEAVLSEFESIGTKAVVDDTWIYEWNLNYCPSPEIQERFLKVHLPVFSSDQRLAVRAVLSLLNEALLDQKDEDIDKWWLQVSIDNIWSKT